MYSNNNNSNKFSYKFKDWMIKYITIKLDDCEQNETLINENIKNITQMIGKNANTNDVLSNIFRFFECIVKLNSKLLSHWMFSGFIHGMLRTDNINILGVTIDLGSFMFIDKIKNGFDENANPHSRIEMYSFKNQISTMAMAMTRVAISLSLILNYKKENVLNQMNQLLTKYYIYLRIEYLQRVKEAYFKDLTFAVNDKTAKIDNYLKNETCFGDWNGVTMFEKVVADSTKWSQDMKLDERCIWCLEYTCLARSSQ